MKNIAIIPARGGSKRIPRKNIKPFMGKPIIAYSIEAALQSGLFDEVMVSTDDEEIAAIARQYGASVPFYRSAETANDSATMENVIEEVLDCYQERGIFFDAFCCVFSTAPFLTSQTLINSYNLFKDNVFDALIPVLSFSYPIQRALFEKGARLFMREPEHIHTRSQDLQPMYHDAGLFYWMKVEKFYEVKEILCDNTGMIELTEEEAQDIDTERDWKIAELKYQILKNNGNINI